MDFETPESVTAILQSVREFCARAVAPEARRWDEAAAFPASLLEGFAELGLWAVLVPEAQGGLGLDALTLSSALECIARHDGAAAWALSTLAGPAVPALRDHLSDVLRDGFLGGIAAGEARVTHALGALGADQTLCAATASGDQWVLRGTLAALPLGRLATHVLCRATTPNGPTAFLLPTHAPGATWSGRTLTLGLRACPHETLSLEGLTVMDLQRLGPVGEADAVLGPAQAMHDLGVASVALGLGEGALAAAVAYARDRRQFGKPIGDLQAIQWMLADSRTELDAARMLVQQAAMTADAGDAGMARRAAGPAAARACHRALQVHGGYGYTREFPVERALRDARMCEVEDDPASRTASALRRVESSAALAGDC
ncbi:MAG: acyl-CoA dehydrogenase family protein [Polyangiales bacterium]